MEKWDLYNRYRELTGEDYVRQNVCKIPKDRFHLVVHVWIKNQKGEYLMSQRSANRPTYPLMWECTGGSVLKGESSLEGAIREVKEELGIDLHPQEGKILFQMIRDEINGVIFRDIADVWMFNYDGLVDLSMATTDEVNDYRWMKKEEVLKLKEDGLFVSPTLDYFFTDFETDKDYHEIIGKEVSGVIDRPMGSAHPNDSKMIYPINYGYVDGIIALDGEYQDAYVFGSSKPISSFKGKVIGVYHRFNDNDDKWIVSIDDVSISSQKILGDIAFCEQFFFGKLYR